MPGTLTISYDGANFYVTDMTGTGTTSYGPYATRLLAELQLASLAPTASEVPDVNVGGSTAHGFVEFDELAGNPTVPDADVIRLFAKDDSGTTRLYTRDRSGNVRKMTNDGDSSGFAGDFGTSIVPTFTEQGSDPAAPSATILKLYAKADGDGATKLFARNATDVREFAMINSSGDIIPTAQDTAATAGKARGLKGGTGNTTGAGGAAAVAGGVGGADAVGGKASVTGGAAGGGNRAGGVAELKSGAGAGTQPGGLVNIEGGVGGATSGTGGRVSITGANGGAPNGSGGNVIAAPGLKSGSGTNGKLQLFDADYTNVLLEVGSTPGTLALFGATPVAQRAFVAPGSVTAAQLGQILIDIGVMAAS